MCAIEVKKKGRKALEGRDLAIGKLSQKDLERRSLREAYATGYVTI